MEVCSRNKGVAACKTESFCLSDLNFYLFYIAESSAAFSGLLYDRVEGTEPLVDARFLVPAARCQDEQGLFGKMWNGRFSLSLGFRQLLFTAKYGLQM